MQREDVERLAHAATMLGLQITDERHRTLREHHENTAAALRALLAERDAVFAAGQESMRGRAAKAVLRTLYKPVGSATEAERHMDDNMVARGVYEAIRALPIKPGPHQSL